MNRAVSFIRLDMYSLKPYAKTFLLFIGMSILMTVVFKSLMVLCAYMMMCLFLVSGYPFSIGETNRLEALYSTLSLKRKDIVAGRYLFVACLEVITFVMALVLSYISSIFFPISFILPEIMLQLCILMFAFSIIVSVQYPVFFLLGYNKAKFVIVVPFIVIALGAVLLPGLLESLGITDLNADAILRFLTNNGIFGYILPVVAGCLAMYLSYLISGRIYIKKDIR